MKLSISAKIFIGFLIVLVTFGAVATHGALTMRRLGDELRLVSRGYLELRLQISELQNGHSNLLRVLVEQLGKGDGPPKVPRFVKFAVDDARRSRLKQQMPAVLSTLRALEQLRAPDEERAPLSQLRARLERLEAAFRDDEELFDQAYGPIGDAPLAFPETSANRDISERLLRREQAVKRELGNLAADLRLRAQQAGLRLEEEQSRAVWATLLLAVVALAVGLIVMAVASRTLRPLKRLAERAQEIARGDYQQRVETNTSDEIGALAEKFNVMAAAIDEREQRLIRSERLAAVGQIAAQITHEVRNPLSSIGLNAELLEEELEALPSSAAQREEARALVRAIVKEVDRLTEITEEYLQFARLPRPRLEKERLGPMVRSLLDFMAGELSLRGITLESDLEAAECSVAADEHQLRQALLNLVRNAAEAMPSGGRLRLSAKQTVDSSHVVLEVADTGEGIDPEHVIKIFDPFFSTKKGGTGLGLALTQQIVNDHGGTIAVRSERGRGTTFTIGLPVTA
jgi:two-component system NtrC family sensor kinase